VHIYKHNTQALYLYKEPAHSSSTIPFKNFILLVQLATITHILLYILLILPFGRPPSPSVKQTMLPTNPMLFV
jgi:hypothetical protein